MCPHYSLELLHHTGFFLRPLSFLDFQPQVASQFHLLYTFCRELSASALITSHGKLFSCSSCQENFGVLHNLLSPKGFRYHLKTLLKSQIWERANKHLCWFFLWLSFWETENWNSLFWCWGTEILRLEELRSPSSSYSLQIQCLHEHISK